jgi:hypothetical protein
MTREDVSPGEVNLDRELALRAQRAARGRRRERRIVWGSLLLAAAVHLLAFAIFPRIQFSVLDDTRYGEEVLRRYVLGGMAVDVHFGPPRIRTPGGGVAVEPPDRVLESRNLGLGELEVHPTCAGSFEAHLPPWEGSVRLQVGRGGLVTVEGIAESTGDRCVDAALLNTAGALLYRWLPSEDYPAPVQLEQPMRLVRSPDGPDRREDAVEDRREGGEAPS